MIVAEPEPLSAVTPAPPSRRNRAVLATSAVLFALWMAALLAMYFTTVYPVRHPRGTPAAAVPDRR